MDDFSAYAVPLSTKKDAREVEDITNRLQKVLSNVELLFEEEDEEFVSERRQFENRYGDISAQMDARDQERAEILKSLAEVLDVQSPSPDMFLGNVEEDEESEVDLSGHIETTKMGFQKLEELKEEMKKLSSKGKPTEHLKKQKSDLKNKVVEKFKMLYAVKKQRNKNKTVGDYWKTAAEDIVLMLRRIRNEGIEDKEAIKEELIKAENTVSRQAENMVRLEHQVLEKQTTIDSLNKTLSTTNGENEMLKSEVDGYRDKVVLLRKQLHALSGKEEPPELVNNHAQTFLSMVALMNAVNDEVTAASLMKEEGLQSVSDAVKESPQYHEMMLRVENLEKKVIEKEMLIMKMERGYTPSISELRRRDSYMEEHEPKPTPDADTEAIDELSLPSKVPKSPKDRSASPSKDDVAATIPPSDDTPTGDDPKSHISQLTEEKTQLQVEMSRLRNQFMDATREIITLKYAVDVLPTRDSGGAEMPSSTVGRAQTPEGDDVREQRRGSAGPRRYSGRGNVENTDPGSRSKLVGDAGPSDHTYRESGRRPSGLPQPTPGSPLGRVFSSGRPGSRLREAALMKQASHMADTDQDQTGHLVGSAGHLLPAKASDSSGSMLRSESQNGSSQYMAFPARGFHLAELRMGVPASQGEKRSMGEEDKGGYDLTDSGMEGFINELQSCSHFMEGVMKDEIARLSEANQQLMKKLSDQSLRYFDQVYSGLLSGVVQEDKSYGGRPRQGGMGGRYDDRPNSPFARRDAFSILQTGGRFLHGRRNAPAGSPHGMPVSDDAVSWDFPNNTPQLWQHSRGSSRVESTPTQGLHDPADASDQGDVLGSIHRLPDDNTKPKLSDRKAQKGARQPLPFSRQRAAYTPDLQRQRLHGSQQESSQSSIGDRRKAGTPLLSSSRGGRRDGRDQLVTPETAAHKRGGASQEAEPEWEEHKKQFREGIGAIYRLEGTSHKAKQRMAKQFTKHFCLSEVKRARRFRSELLSAKMSRKDALLAKGRSLDHLASNMLMKRIQSLLYDMEQSNQQHEYTYQSQKLPRITHTQSLSSLENISSMYPKGTKRHWIKLPKAKYPGRGYVVVQTENFPIYRGELLKKNADDKVVSHRPVPKTHHQLNVTHRLLLEKQMREQLLKDQQTLRNVVKLQDGMKFFPRQNEASCDDTGDIHHIIKNAHEQLFHPDTLRQNYLAVFEGS